MLLALGSAAYSYAATTVEITTNVLIKNVPPVGVHMVDNYWNGPLLKRRVVKNFEGTRFRRIHTGILRTNGFYIKNQSYWSVNYPNWEHVITNSEFYIVSDPVKGVTGKVVKMADETINYKGWNRTWCFLTFDNPIMLPPGYDDEDVGVLLYNDNYLTAGCVGDTNRWIFSDNNNFIVTNDCAPGSFGNSSCRMDGTSSTSYQQHQTLDDGGTTLNTSWRVCFWLKKDSGTPTVKCDLYSNGTSSEYVTVPTNWEHREVVLNMSMDNFVGARIQVTGGAILIDDITVDQIEGDSNDVWRTEAMDLYKEYNPGTLRVLTMGGMSIEDQLKPNLETYGYKCEKGTELGTYEWQSKESLTVQDACFVCEELGCALWYNISGTIFPREVTNLIEFLAAPTNTYWGNERAKQGHPEPWTKSIKEFQIQFGNECWNTVEPFLFKGFNGPDYWYDIISYAKSSPYYTNNILFVPAGRTRHEDQVQKIIDDCPNADKFTVGAYTDRWLFDTDRPRHGDEDLFKWYLSLMVFEVFSDNYMGIHKEQMKEIEFAFYEYNVATHHGDASRGDFNLLNPSLAQGIGLANYSLLNLKEYGVRYQNFYNMTGKTAGQPGYNDTDLFGLMHGMKSGEQHKRPVWYANMIMNKVRNGNLMETSQSGDNPDYISYGRFDDNSYEYAEWTSNSFNTIYSYAFQSDTGTNGIILFNYDLSETQDVQILLKEYVKNNAAEMWMLTSDCYSNNNEFVQGIVTSEYSVISGFKSGYQISMPPLSEIVLKWVSDGVFPNLKTSVTNLYINEGSNAAFNVQLTSEPENAVTVSIARVSGDTNITVQSGSPAVLDSSNWAAGETITLFASEDDDAELGKAVFECTAEGMPAAEVTAHELENDKGILVNPSEISVPKGGNNNFYVRLSTDPGSALAVSVAKVSGDANISVAPATLNFNASNWETEQPVTVSAAEDYGMESSTAVIACTTQDYLSNTVIATVIPAADITVTTTADSGVGSLRQAVIDAAAGNKINFSFATYPATIVLTTGEIDINKNITITGRANPRDIVIDGNANDFIFRCDGGHTYNISGLTVSNGLNASAGGIYVWNSGTRLNLSNCVVTACATTASGNGNGGGGVIFEGWSANGGTIVNCLFSGNSVPPSGNNSSAEGGAIYIGRNTANVKIKACSFENNSAGGDGGAVSIREVTTVQIEDSTFFGNTSLSNCGGAVYACYDDTRALDIINCTFVGNSAINQAGGTHTDGLGGAIFAQRGYFDMYNSTIVANSAGRGGGLYSTGPATGQDHNLYSCIFGYNTAISGNPDLLLTGDGMATNCIYSGAPAGNVSAIPDVSTTLADNGGPTLTLMIDNPGNCMNEGSNPLSLAYDQRGPGYNREADGVADIGAIEGIPEPCLFIIYYLSFIIYYRRKSK